MPREHNTDTQYLANLLDSCEAWRLKQPLFQGPNPFFERIQEIDPLRKAGSSLPRLCRSGPLRQVSVAIRRRLAEYLREGTAGLCGWVAFCKHPTPQPAPKNR